MKWVICKKCGISDHEEIEPASDEIETSKGLCWRCNRFYHQDISCKRCAKRIFRIQAKKGFCESCVDKILSKVKC